MWTSDIHISRRWYQLASIGIGLLVTQFHGCSGVIPPVSHALVAISAEDRNDLRSGNLYAIRERYEKRGSAQLRNEELAVLCDIYVKHMSIEQALECLEGLQARSGKQKLLPQVAGKRALIAFMLGHYRRAASLSRDLQGAGGQYVHALAQIRLGNSRIARELASRWQLAFDPEPVFLAANLYLAMEAYEEVLKVSRYPEPDLVRYYSLSGTHNVFGQHVKPAPLKLDLFDEYGFGLLDTYSYAPPVNVYVEYLLAKSLMETGDIDAARIRYDTILDYPNIGAYLEVHWRSLHDRAYIAHKWGNVAKAIELNRQAVEIIEGVRASISTEAGRIAFVGDKQTVYSDLIKLLIASGDVDAAFEYTERARSRALVDVLATQQKFGRRGKVEVGFDLDRLMHDYQRAQSRILELQGHPTATDIKSRTTSCEAECRRIMRQAPMLHGILEVDKARAKLDKMQKKLLSNETLLSYFKADKDWYLFVLTQQGKAEKWKLDLPSLTQEIADFRRLLISGAQNRYIPAARHLYDSLIRPVAGRLKEIVTLVPFGELHYLPFAALHTGREFLIQKHSLRIIPSAEVLTLLGSSERPRGGLLAFGNPTRSDITTLPFAEKEAQQVARIYQPSELLLGIDASLSNFVQKAGHYDILHIAAHGEFNRVEPLQSRLLLAPSPGNTGDLTAAELYSIEPGLNANIAVLSACETALADIAMGDELIGLQRGFLYAGVESIVGSLWIISDETTVYLMERFYEALRQRESRVESLRHAQIKTMKRYPNASTWAAFTYTGSLY